MNVKARNVNSQKEFDNTYYVGTYSELIIQTKYPKELSEDIDQLFQKTKTFEDLDIKKLHDIANQKTTIKLTVIKNLEMAKQLGRSIIEQIE